MTKPELLAPAGGEESVIAAVRNGADAVYLGGEEFSARRSAHNFNTSQLADTVKYCHAHGVKIHLAVNILVFNEEIQKLCAAVKTAVECGVDALIVQDLGAARIIKRICPDIPLHASTQLSVHTPDGVAAMKKLGFDRVVLSRELSLCEIEQIAKSTDLELEVFVHGALCMSVSGQCYFSAMLGSRSGNRGLCAQTCRLKFSAFPEKEGHALSLKDLCAKDSISGLMKAGVKSFKIEGRMKRPEYVAAAVKAYRSIIDSGDADISDLKAVFSRSGFTNGYLENVRGGEMFGYRKKEDVTAAAGVLKSLQGTYHKEIQNVGVTMDFTMAANERITLFMSDGEHTVSGQGAFAQKAVNTSIPEQRIKQSLAKLGSTPYYAKEISVKTDGGVTVSAADINALRRECCEKLTQRRCEVKKRTVYDYKQEKNNGAHFGGKTEIYARFEKARNVTDYAVKNVAKIILPIDEILAHTDIICADKTAAELPRALFGEEDKLEIKLEKLKMLGIKEAFAGNIASVVTARSLGLAVHGGYSLNIVNDAAVAAVKELGVKSAVVSPELMLSQIASLSAEIPLGIFAYGRLPLMLTRNCPLKSEIGCDKCKKSSELYDRKKISFPVACRGGYTEVLNSAPIYMADRQREVTGCEYLLLYFTNEQEADKIIRAYLSGEAPRSGKYTRGLYYRGVL